MTAPFVLDRHEDVSGVSGEGIVAEGVVWSDGEVALHWPGEYPTTSTHRSVESVEAIHGHDGKTVVEFLDEIEGTWLQRIADLAPHHRHIAIEAPSAYKADDGTIVDLQVRVHAYGSEEFADWVEVLGGKVDAAARHEYTLESAVWRWLTPDGQVAVIYLVDRGEDQ